MSEETTKTHALPTKPREGEPCNGCGVCCMTACCHEAERRLSNDAEPPCVFLRQIENQFRCGLVLDEIASGADPQISESLCIGLGCTMPDGIKDPLDAPIQCEVILGDTRFPKGVTLRTIKEASKQRLLQQGHGVMEETVYTTTAQIHRPKIYEQTMSLRWLMHQTTAVCVLEQAWVCRETGEIDWRPVPVEVVP